MSSIHPQRCAQHGLAVAPDGLCVLCRRQQAGGAPPLAAPETVHVAPITFSAPPALHGAGKWLGLGLLLLVAAGGAGAWHYAQAARTALASAAPGPAALVAAPPEAAQTDADAQSALDKAKARDLAESLQKLERAQAEQEAAQLQQQSELSAQRSAAEAARKQEEATRDAARHAQVMRDLEQQGQAEARRRVQITMYSTTWCGYCKRARAYLREHSIAYTEHDVEHDAAARQRARQLNPSGGVPTFAIDQELMVGFSPDELEATIARAAQRRKQ